MQVVKIRGKTKLKKVISAAIIAGILGLQTMPALAADNITTAAPKQFKSMVKKNKKTSDDYKYAYVNIDFWDKFNDDILSGYIQKAIINNYDLKMATLNVEEYYQQTRLQFAHELPTATVGASPALTKMPGATNTDMFFAVPAIVNYEADIFLKNRDKTKSVKKLYENAQFDERAPYISIASAVGSTYLNLVALDKTIELQEEIVKSRKQIYDLMVLSNKEGLVSTADTVKANKAYVKGQTDLIELNKQRETALTQLCVLLGESPENAKSLERSNFDDLNYNNEIPDYIASEIIIQRPDYLKEENSVEKAGIDVRVAKKEFLPSINITGLALFNAGDIGSIFTTKNALFALAGGALLPIFTGGQKIANLRLKKATYERILQNYYKTNLTAIQEVNDALVKVKLDKQKVDQTLKQANLERADYKFNEHKFNQGTISKLDLIQYKENLLTIDQLVAQNKVEFMVDYIGLYKATGSKLN